MNTITNKQKKQTNKNRWTPEGNSGHTSMLFLMHIIYLLYGFSFCTLWKVGKTTLKYTCVSGWKG